MIHDFLMLEMYYGQSEAAQYLEDIVKRHGDAAINTARSKGHIIIKTCCFGPDQGRSLCWLSAKGRDKAQDFLTV